VGAGGGPGMKGVGVMTSNCRGGGVAEVAGRGRVGSVVGDNETVVDGRGVGVRTIDGVGVTVGEMVAVGVGVIAAVPYVI